VGGQIPVKSISCYTCICFFTGINIAGVKWVVRFQLILLIVMFLSVMDFLVGSFVHTEPGKKNTQYFRNDPKFFLM